MAELDPKEIYELTERNIDAASWLIYQLASPEAPEVVRENFKCRPEFGFGGLTMQFGAINSTGTIDSGGLVNGRDMTADGVKSDYITVTQAVDLDTLETNSHTHSNKANLDTIDQDLATTDSVFFSQAVVESAITNPTVYFGLNSELNSHSTSNTAGLITSTYFVMNKEVDSGITFNGAIFGGYYATRVSGAGLLAKAEGFRVDQGIASGAGPITVTDMYGINIIQLAQDGVITNLYGLHIEDVPGGGIVTNKWAMYSDWDAPTYFKGSLGIGVDNPTEKLEVNGVIRSTGRKSADGTPGISSTHGGITSKEGIVTAMTGIDPQKPPYTTLLVDAALGSTVTVTTAGTWYSPDSNIAVKNDGVRDYLREFVYSGGSMTYTGTTSGIFQISASLSVTSDTNNVIVSFGHGVNGADPDDDDTIDRKIGVGTDVGAVSVSNMVYLEEDDTIDLFITTDMSGVDITLTKGSFNMIFISEL